MTPIVQEIEARPRRCPRCRSDDVLTIVYGLVSDPAPFVGKRVAFGGCHITPESPEWECADCAYNWRCYRRDPSER